MKSFVDTNKRHEYYYHAYAWNESDDLSELSKVCKTISYHVLEPQPQYPFSTTNTKSNCHRNNFYVMDIKAVDNVLKLDYDLVIHVDLDMLCIKSVENYLDELLERTDSWEIAGAEEPDIETTYKNDMGFSQPYKFPNEFKLNFGFLVLNPKTVKSNNIELFSHWWDLYGDSLAGCSEVYFSLQYSKQVIIREVNYMCCSRTSNLDTARIIHYIGSTKSEDAFPSPYNTIKPENKKFIKTYSIYLHYAELANCSKEFIGTLKENIMAVYPNYNTVVDSYRLTSQEIDIAKLKGLEYLYKYVGNTVKTAPTESTDLNIGKSVCFTSVVNSNYIDPAYVFVRSLFMFNDVQTYKLFYVNATDTELKTAQKRFRKISKNIEVIKIEETAKKTPFHWDYTCIQIKMKALDILSKEYDLTVLTDVDTLVQGNYKDTLLSTLFTEKRIFGTDDIHHRENLLVSLPAKVVKNYINGGLIIVKKGEYNFYERFIKFNETYRGVVLPEQDFISAEFQKEIKLLSPKNNLRLSARRLLKESDEPIMIHYSEGFKPFVNYEYLSEKLKSHLNGIVTASQSVLGVYNYVYLNYIKSLNDKSLKDFIQKCEDNLNSDNVREYYEKLLLSLSEVNNG